MKDLLEIQQYIKGQIDTKVQMINDMKSQLDTLYSVKDFVSRRIDLADSPKGVS